MSIAERWNGHPPLPSDLEERLPRVIDRLRRGGARLIYLFGSSAPDADPGGRPPGDLDLAVWGLEEDRWGVQADVAEVLGTDRVDLVPMEDAGAELRFRIISTGKLLYRSDVGLENQVESRILREYQDLAPFRRTQSRYLRARHASHGP